MKKILPLLLLNLMFLPLISQEYELEWAFKVDAGANNVILSDIELDSEGNLIAVGQYTNAVDFDPSGGSTILNSNGNLSYFVCKYDANGNLLWARTKDLNSNGGSIAHEILVDENDNIYVSGGFNGEIDLDMTSGQLILAPGSQIKFKEGVFLLKLNKEGDYKWAWGIETKLEVSITYGWSGVIPHFDILSDGGIIYSSVYSDSIDVDFTPNQQILKATAVGNEGRFLLKCDTSMNFLWAQNFDSYSTDIVYNIKVDSKDNYYVLGHYFDSLNINPSGSPVYLRPNISSNNNLNYIAKYSSNGILSWAHSLESATGGGLYFFLSTLDDEDNLYVYGTFQTDISLDPLNQNNKLYAKDFSFFSAKYDKDGYNQWYQKHALGKRKGSYLTLNPCITYMKDKLFLSVFSDSTQWDMNDLSTKISTVSQSIARFNKDGEFETFLQLDVTNNKACYGIQSLAINEDQTIYQFLTIDGSVDMDPSSTSFMLNSQSTFPKTSMMLGKYSFKYLGVQETNPISLNGIDIFPNPAGRYQKVHIKSNTDDLTEVKIYNLTGQKIKSIKLANNIRSMELDIRNYSKGVYLLKISTKSGTTSKRLVITE